MGPKRRTRAKKKTLVTSGDDHENLYRAVAKGDCEMVLNLLQSGIPVDIPDSTGSSVIHRLASNKNITLSEEALSKVLQLLIDNGADVNKTDSLGRTPLHLAMQNECIKTAMLLIHLGADPNPSDREGYTVLHRLAKCKCKETKMSSLLALLITRSIDLGALCPDGKTALHLAVKNNKWSIVKALLDNGCLHQLEKSEQVSILDKLASGKVKWNETVKVICDTITEDSAVDCSIAFQLAAKTKKWDMVNYLLPKVSNVTTVDDEQLSLLHRITSDRKIASNNKRLGLDILKIAIERGADILEKDPQGNTPIQLAAKHGLWEMVDRMLSLSTDLNELDSEGFSLLHRVAQEQIPHHKKIVKRHTELLNTLITKGASIDLPSSSRDTALHIAVKGKNWLIADELLRKGAQTDLLGCDNLSVLHIMAFVPPLRSNEKMFKSYRSVVKLLLSEKRNSIDAKDLHNNTALHIAAKVCNWYLVKQFIQHGVDLNLIDGEGFTILHRLAINSTHCFPDLELLRFFLDHGAHQDTPSSNGDLVIHVAALRHEWDLVQELVTRGVDVNIPDSEGFCVTHRLAMYGSDSARHNLRLAIYGSDFSQQKLLLQQLLDHGANQDIVSPKGDQVIHIAALHHRWDMVQELVSRGVDVNVPDSEGFCVTHRLAMIDSDSARHTLSLATCRFDSSQQKLLLQQLLDHGANQDTVSPKGDQVIHIAALHHKWDMVQELVSRGVDVNVPDSEGFCVIHRLVMHDSDSSQHNLLFQKLLEHGAKLDMPCPKDENILQLAAKSKSWNMVKWLLEDERVPCCLDGEQRTILHHLAALRETYRYSSFDEITLLCELILNRGVDINAKDKYGNTALHLAAKREWWKLVEHLINKGAEACSKDEEHLTVLHRMARASSNGGRLSIEFLNLVLSCGVNLNDQDPCGNTPLHIAAKTGTWSMVELLIQNGAELNTHDDDGLLPIHRLSMYKLCPYTPDIFGKYCDSEMQLRIADLVLDTMKVITQRDPHGFMPIQVAAKNGHWKLLEKFLPFVMDVNEMDTEGFTILHRIASTYDGTIVSNHESFHPLDNETDAHIIGRILSFGFEKGAQIDLPCKSGETALSIAAVNNNWNTVEELFNRTADVEIPNNDKYLLIHTLAKARISNDLEARLWQALLAKDININIPDAEGNSALQTAATNGKWETVVFLIESGAQVQPFYRNGETLFHWLSETDRKFSLDDVICFAHRFLKCNVDINHCNDHGNTALHNACNRRYKCWPLIKGLVQNGAKADICDKHGQTVFHSLCSVKYSSSEVIDILKVIIANGIDINHTGIKGQTALQTSLKGSNWSLFGLLWGLGAHYKLSEKEKLSVLNNLRSFTNDSYDEETLYTFIKYLYILDSPQKTNLQYKNKQTAAEEALWSCVSSGSWDIVHALVRCGVPINLHFKQFYEPLILHLVRRYKHDKRDKWLAFLDLLLSHGLDINCRCGQYVNVLHNIIQHPRNIVDIPDVGSIVSVLLVKGANLLETDENGFTLLRLVVSNPEKHDRDITCIINVLIEAGLSTYQPRYSRINDCDVVIPTYKIASPTEFILKTRKETCLPILRKLIESGASSNSELRRLYEEFELEMSRQNRIDVNTGEILSVLRHAACFPRSLRSLCRLTISHAVGCGPIRKTAIESLEVPLILKEYLLFSDILAP